MQGVDEVGRCGLEPLGFLDECSDGGRAGVGRDDGIELVEQSAKLAAGSEQLLAAVVGGRGDGGQDADAVVVAAAGRCRNDISELADGGLKNDRRQFGVLGYMSSVGYRGAAGASIDQLDGGHREHIVGHHSGAYRRRNVFGVLRVEVDVHVVRSAVGCWLDVVDAAHEQPVVLDVGSGGQTVTDVVQVGDHADVVVESSGGLQQHRDGGR